MGLHVARLPELFYRLTQLVNKPGRRNRRGESDSLQDFAPCGPAHTAVWGFAPGYYYIAFFVTARREPQEKLIPCWQQLPVQVKLRTAVQHHRDAVQKAGKHSR